LGMIRVKEHGAYLHCTRDDLYESQTIL
jgi:hypothetical protein